MVTLITNYQLSSLSSFLTLFKSGVYTGSSQHKADFHCSRSCHQLNLLVFRLDSRSSSQKRWDAGYSTFEQHHQLNPPEEKQVSTFEQLWVTEWVAPVGAGPEQSGATQYTVHSYIEQAAIPGYTACRCCYKLPAICRNQFGRLETNTILIHSRYIALSKQIHIKVI